MDIDNYQCVPEGSICEGCVYCVKRLITPLEDSDFEIYEQETEEDVFVHCQCIVLNIDLHDHIVRACNYYTEEEADNPFFNNKFLGG